MAATDATLLLGASKRPPTWSGFVAAHPLSSAAVAVLALGAVAGVTTAAVIASRAAASATSSGPEQVMLTIMSPTSLGVTWAVAEGASYTPFNLPAKNYLPDYRVPVVVNSGVPAVLPRVRWGIAPDALNSSSPANQTRYSVNLNRDWRKVVANATSSALLSAVFGPLVPGQTYYYSVGDDANGFTAPVATVAPPAAGAVGARFAVIGDLGTTSNSSATLAHVLAEHASAPFAALLYLGDLSYSDGEMPVWESFGRLFGGGFGATGGGVAAVLPIGAVMGNHEWGQDNTLSFTKRYRTPAGGNASRQYYSLDIGLLHVVFVQGYCPELSSASAPNVCLGAGSAQRAWLIADFAARDTARTPWTVVIVHQPWHNSNEAHSIAREGVWIADALEDLVQGADLILSGHVHAYERCARAYRWACNASAPVSIVVGDGGNREGLAANWTQPQPAWSLLRQASFGHGVIEPRNATHLHWSWIQSPALAPKVGDEFWLIKNDPGQCGGGETRQPLMAAAAARGSASRPWLGRDEAWER